MIIALGVMLVTSLLLIAAFTAANGDIHLSHRDTAQKQAYYAALAGVQEYEYKLQGNPNYWQTCEEPVSTVAEEGSSGERYEVKLLHAHSAPETTKKCETANPFVSMIESKGSVANTFRIESVGCAGKTELKSCIGQTPSLVAKRSVVATFKVNGFLNYIYYTNFETEDPGLYNAPAGCANSYYKQWSKAGLSCATITFTSGDSVDGPMHTNDAAKVEGTATFGRKGQSPPDAVEINGGTYPTVGCPSSATYYTGKEAKECYTEGPTITPPESDTSLRSYVEPAYEFTGVTHLELRGSAGTIVVTHFKEEASGELVEKKETVPWPENGLIYVQGNPKKPCEYLYESENSDTSADAEKEKNCGNVYVSGSYGKSLTIAGENDLIVNGNVFPTSVEGSLGSKPTGTTTLGLIASHYVRVYHPCPGVALSNPWIYAAILSTAHSWVVDNSGCGSALGELHVYGAIAQDYRGIVGRVGGAGYLKDYKYDERLATDEPPYFLAPLKAGWKVARETAPEGG